MTKRKQPDGAAVLRTLHSKRETARLKQLYRQDKHAAKEAKQLARLGEEFQKKDGRWVRTQHSYQYLLLKVERPLVMALRAAATFNAHPGLEYHGHDPISTKCLEDTLAYVRRAASKTLAPMRRAEMRKEQEATEVAKMNALTAAGMSRNAAAREVVGSFGDPSPLLKRFRKIAGKSVAK